MRRPRVPLWLGYLVAAAAASAAYWQSTSTVAKTVLVVTVAASGALAVVVGLRRYRPDARVPWLLVGATQALWAIAWLWWQLAIVRTGLPPGLDDPVNFVFQLGNAALLAALLVLAVRAQRDRVALLDGAIIAAGLATISWALLLEDFVEDETLPALGRAYQAGYSLLDVLLAAALLRALLSGRVETRSSRLLIAGAAGLVASDVVWNWSTKAGDYVPGVWGDLGWLAFHSLAGAAALHPSMRRVFATGEVRPVRVLRPPQVLLLAVAVLVAPALAILEKTEVLDTHFDELAFGAAATSLLVLARLVANVRDSQRLASRLAAAESRFRSVYESAPVGITVLEPDGTVLEANPAREAMLGADAGSLSGRAFTEWVLADDRRAAVEALAAAARGTETQTERRDVAADGTVRWVRATFSPLSSDDGEQLVLAIAEDVTERRAADAERERLLEREREQVERLRELDRLKDDFVASVSHELRTPLTSIRGYLELLADGEGGELTDDQRRFVAIVERNANRLLRLVGDLLFIAQVDAGKLTLEPGEVGLEPLLAEAVEGARPAADAKGVELRLDAEALPPLVGDAARLAQAVDNLLSNAVKFTPEGGSIQVRARTTDAGVRLEVADTGMGVPAAEQQRLFDRFFRSSSATERAIQGTGLGLAITKAIVTAHGGEISAQSREGEGTTFTIELPASPALAPV